MNKVLQELAAVIEQRKSASSDSSYVASLHGKGLKKILEKVALKNEQNKFLLNHSIHFVQTMIKDLLSSKEDMNDLYAQNGRKLDPKYLALLDRRI